MKKPRIGIVANLLIVESGMLPGIYRSYVNQDYIESLEKAGCLPVLLPVLTNLEDVKEQIEYLDGIVLSGGYDIDPFLYGEQPIPGQGFTMSEVDRYYMEVIAAADQLGKPVFGICKGLQALNVAFGGTMYQDLGKQCPKALQHTQQAPRYAPTHFVQVEPNSFLATVLPQKAKVNSFHHQAIKDLAKDFRVTAQADDGVIEGIERKQGTFMCGVQWHPEMMAKFDDTTMVALFRQFAQQCMANNND